MSATWIKLCGLSTEEDVQTAIDAGVQAVGFVFAQSPRAVSPSMAARLAGRLPDHVVSVAVMLRPSQAEVDDVLTEFSPRYLQADWQSVHALTLPDHVTVLPVHREGDGVAAHDLPSRFVFEGAKSGQGQTVNWEDARPFARSREMVLAGGLDPSNVAQAISVLRPFGVDVSSGIEQARGVKDPERMHAFVEQVRLSDRTRGRDDAPEATAHHDPDENMTSDSS